MQKAEKISRRAKKLFTSAFFILTSYFE